MARRISLSLPFLLLLLPQLLWLKPASPSTTIALQGCQDRCGDVSLPYPFGIGRGCSRDDDFTVFCNDTLTPPKAYMFSNESNIDIINITLSEGQIRIHSSIAWMCYDRSGNEIPENSNGWIGVGVSKYKFSYTLNVFTAIGCNTLSLIKGHDEFNYTGGCASICPSVDSVEKGRCSGMGCCQTGIPRGLDYYEVQFRSFFNQSLVWGFNPCSYAFIAEEGWYDFNTSDLYDYNFYNKYVDGVPLVLDWVAGTETCEKARLNKSSYACVSANSECYDIPASEFPDGGYRCNCSSGYEGNPYITGGCQDINECERPNDCPRNSICVNKPGSHTCYCPRGTKLDPTTHNCKKRQFPTLALALGLSIGLLFLFVLGSWVYWGYQRRKIMISRQKFFEQNGGLLLKRQISSQHEATFKIFTVEQLEKATNEFDKQMILGQGAQGTVYKGNMDNREVAIKKSRIIDESQRNGFATEMLILSQINHKNVVKLLGCCLEVDIPILVYEFISKGTLFHYIHRGRHRSPISFTERLRIATEAAQALDYLHAQADPPIVHRDVKSANMLLDENFMVKISDFGASKLTPMDKAQFATLIQGTYGYLDPESLQTYQLTTKSDVYSFGVVLAELLTGKRALYSDDGSQERSLALDFVSSVKDKQLLKILDVQIMNEGDIEYACEVAKLTCRCLSMKGEERPTMKEVAFELEGIRNLMLALGEPHSVKDTEPLLGEQSSCYVSNTSTYFSSASNALSLEGGR